MRNQTQKLSRVILGVALLGCLLPFVAAFCRAQKVASFAGTEVIFPPQSKANVPIPEYFGIYAVDNGKLTALIGSNSSEFSGSQTVELFSFETNSSKNYSVLAFSSDIHFVVFDQASGEVADALYLYRLPYARNLDRRVSARLGAFRTQLMGKPIQGQPQMIELVPGKNLLPGVYALFYLRRDGRYQIVRFLIGSLPTSDPTECVDVSLAFSGGAGGPLIAGIDAHDYFLRHEPVELLELTPEHYATCGAAPFAGRPGATGGTPGSGPGLVSPVPCVDYDSCVKNGINALLSSQWNGALSAFQTASTANPSKPQVWRLLGETLSSTGQDQAALAMLDKALQLGGVWFYGCYARSTFSECHGGTLLLSTAEVSFTDEGSNEKIFSAPPTGVRFVSASRSGNVKLSVAGKNYSLSLRCDYPSLNQETKCISALVNRYVAETIPKLASGQFSAGAGPIASGTPSDSANQQLIEKIKRIIDGDEKAVNFQSPMDSPQFLELVVKESQQPGVPLWLLFGQAQFETTFGYSKNATVRDGMPFTDGTIGNAHNLFNIRPGSAWTGKILDTGQGGQFRVYGTYDECVRDYLRLMSSNLYRGKTLKQLVNTYFPASDNTPARVQSYIDSLIQFAGKLGIAVNIDTVPVQ